MIRQITSPYAARPAHPVRAVLGGILPLLLLCLPLTPAMAATIHVPAEQPTIQAGIDAATNGDTVLVASGLYSGDGNRDLDFGGRAITVRSEGGANLCIIDCGGVTGDEPHRGFFFHSGEGETSVVQGFTIRNGDVEQADDFRGGAILCVGASPRIVYNILTGNRAGWGGAIGCGENASPTIVQNTICGNRADGGGGIYCGEGSVTHIALNTISDNQAGYPFNGWGGGILCDRESMPSIVDNRIIDNEAFSYFEFPGRGGGICSYGDGISELSGNEFRGNSAGVGGGIYLTCETATITNNIFQDNAGSGGGICFEEGGSLTVFSCTFFGNTGTGGGIYYNGGFHGPSPLNRLVITNSILWGNGSEGGSEIYVDTVYGGHPMALDISYTDVEGGPGSIFLDTGAAIDWGAGMINADPLFAYGPNGDHYLSQLAAGQPVLSPCVDAGDPAGETVPGTTRTDGQPDTGIADMGYHYGSPVREPETLITSGPGWGSDSPVIVFTFSGRDDDDIPDELIYTWKVDDGSWSAYSASTRAVLSGLPEGAHTFYVRARDTDGRTDNTTAVRTFFYEAWAPNERWTNIVTGPGPGPHNPPLVRTPEAEWLAYGPIRCGVNVACGNITGGAAFEVITGPGPGAVFGPHVRCWTMGGDSLPGDGFMAYGTLRWGVNVAAGNIDGDAFDEIVTGAGPGPVFGPHVRAFDYDGSGSFTPVGGCSYFAYGTLRWGVNVACGDINGDGVDEIITGAGPGPVFGPHVRGWRYNGTNATVPVPGASYFAYATPRYGVEVSCGDVDGDGIDEILTAPGPGSTFYPHIRGWTYADGHIAPMPNVNFFAFGTAGYGSQVSAGDVDLDGKDEILTMPGPNPAASPDLTSWDVEAGYVSRNYDHTFWAYDRWMTHGGNVAGVR